MPIYTVKSPLMHDNIAYNVGDELELRERHADTLLKAGALAPRGAREAKAPAADKDKK